MTCFSFLSLLSSLTTVSQTAFSSPLKVPPWNISSVNAPSIIQTFLKAFVFQITSIMEPQPRLASLQQITAIREMNCGPDYEHLVVITLSGKWDVVVYRNTCELGELLVFFKGGSFILDVNGRFDQNDPQLLAVSNGQRGYRVVTGMFGSEISHGYIQRIDTIREVESTLEALQGVLGCEAGLALAMQLDWDRILGVEKWEVPSHGVHLGRAPPFLSRQDVPAADEIDGLFTDRYIDAWYQVTEKIDGIQMTVYQVALGSKWHSALPKLPYGSNQENGGVRVGVTVADYDLDERSNDIYWEAAKALDIPSRLRHLGYQNVAAYGELVGPGINDNTIGFPEDAYNEFYIFALFDIDAQRFLTPAHTVFLCDQLGLPHVPVLGYVCLGNTGLNLHSLISQADGVGQWGQPREGLIFKDLEHTDLWFKVDSPSWLFEEGGFAA